MKFLSVCSGIEAASVAWSPLGWEAVGFSEIAPFPSAVLSHHYPSTPNFGDLTQYHDWPATLRPDLVIAGTPCQSFSVAGLRKGLADPRGNLTLVFLGLLAQFRPQWVVWENVPGVLSDKTGAFGAFLGGLGELGYGFAYRILDAQYTGVPQQRRRVFVVGYLGDWRRAAAVLFEPESLRGDPPPGRKTGKGPAPTLAGCLGGSSQSGGFRATDLDGTGAFIPMIQSKTHALRGEGFDASEDGTGRGTPLVPVHTTGAGFWQEGFGTLRAREQDSHENLLEGAFRTSGNCGAWDTGDRVDALNTGTDPCSHVLAFSGRSRGDDGRGYDRPPNIFSGGKVGAVDTVKPHHVAYTIHGTDKTVKVASETQIAGCLRTRPPGSMENSSSTVVGMGQSCVRRLTPRECERLQGFPDDYTAIPWGKKSPADCPDGPRYKAIGNSMAVPVIQWIGRRIDAVDQLPLSTALTGKEPSP